MQATWLDRTIGYLSPTRQLHRVRARAALEFLAKHYESGEINRRTQGWRRPGGDPNAPSNLSLSRLRDSARDMVRNNPHAQSALQTIVDDTVGWGIVAGARHEAWKAWSTSTDIDAEGRSDLVGIQHAVMRAVVQDGEALVWRRWRRMSDGLALPMQVQVLEADFLDATRDKRTAEGGKIVKGIEFDARGKRQAYWLFPEHPGSSSASSVMRFQPSVRVPATEILHIYRPQRPGQVRGASWFAPVLLRFHDFDEYEDATLMKQKISACLAVITSDIDGTGAPLGTEDPDDADQDLLEPGMILNVAPGRSLEVVRPPSVREHGEFVEVTLRSIATGLGVTYEDLTGDYTDLPFSAARMSRLRHWARVEGWRWRMLVPQLLNPLWRWAMQAAQVAGRRPIAFTEWTAPPLPMIEPDKEGLAVLRNIRTGIQTPSEAIRERGWVPELFWDEYQKDFEDQDTRGIVTDADPRKMTQAGQRHKDVTGEETDVAALERMLAEGR